MDKLGPYPFNSIITGDAKILAKEIPDESVDLIFTDPVYDRIEDYEWLAKTAKRVLKTKGNCLVFCGHPQQIEVGAAMLPFLEPRLVLSTFMCPPYPRLFGFHCHVNASPLLWFSKGKGVPHRWITLQYSSSYHYKNRNHQWGKNFAVCYHWLSCFTNGNNAVLDLFAGGGTILSAAKMLGCNYLAFEINPETAELARQQVANTQSPLFMPEPQQLELSV